MTVKSVFISIIIFLLALFFIRAVVEVKESQEFHVLQAGVESED
jgi:hypothetical protein